MPYSLPTQGYFVEMTDLSFSTHSKRNHKLCGSHNITNGICPNCSKPLLRLLDLSVSDERLEIRSDSFESVPLLFCWTCNIAQEPFFYQIVSSNSIHLLEYGKGGVTNDFPFEHYPLYFPERRVILKEISPDCQSLIQMINSGDSEISYAYPELAKPRHQIGGEPFLFDYNSMACISCKNEIPLLATIGDEAPDNISFTGNEFVQIAYYFCRNCSIVGASQMCD